MPRTLATKVITVEENLLEACRQFNAGQFFECHETLEEIWQEEQGDVRDLYKGLIQVAAAYVHITRGNYIGADRLLRTAVSYLEPYRVSGAMGFDVEAICFAAERQHAELARNGPERVLFDPALVPNFEVDAAVLEAEGARWNAWGFERDGTPLRMTITVLD